MPFQFSVGNGLCAVPLGELIWLRRLALPERHGGRSLQNRALTDKLAIRRSLFVLRALRPCPQHLAIHID